MHGNEARAENCQDLHTDPISTPETGATGVSGGGSFPRPRKELSVHEVRSHARPLPRPQVVEVAPNCGNEIPRKDLELGPFQSAS